MKPYRTWKPTQFDTAGICLDDRQDWLVLPCGRNRDSEPFTESNFVTTLSLLGGESDTVEVHRFGHWACGWLEIILVDPASPAFAIAESIEDRLSNYPILDETDFSEREHTAANETWSNCYNAAERIAYIRKHRSQFEFHDWADMLSCVRGRYFAGYASELIGG